MTTQQTAAVSAARTRSRGWIGGLDGLRAIAVIVVVIFHLNPDYLPGGFAGVDIFFVISGYLITRLLFDERARSGFIALKAFYIRRARRLLPAVGVLLAVVLVAGTLIWRDQRPTLSGSVLSSATYVTNWWLIGADQSYFVTTGRPPMLQHLWSLAIEEQYYVLWAPIVIGLCTVAVRWRRSSAEVVAGAAALAALASTGLMAWIALRDGIPFQADSSRVYFGTDTHTMGLFVGSAVGAATHISWRGRLDWVARLGRLPVATTDFFAALLLAVLFAAMVVFNEFEPALYLGGFLLFSLVTVAVIVGAARQGSRLGRALDMPLLRWIGQRSYGIYLWHWPVAVVTRPGIDVSGPAWIIDPLRAGITVALAAASYRFVEERWRTRRVAEPVLSPAVVTRGSTRKLAVAGVAALCAVVIVVGQLTLSQRHTIATGSAASLLATDTGTGTGTELDTDRDIAADEAQRRDTSYVVSTPILGPLRAAPSSAEQPGWEQSLVGGTSDTPVLPPVAPAPEPEPTPEAEPEAAPEAAPTETPAVQPEEKAETKSTTKVETKTETKIDKPSTKKAKKKPVGSAQAAKTSLAAFGDSVLLGAQRTLKSDFKKVSVVAEVGLQPWDLLDDIAQRHQRGKLGKVVLIHTGNNGIISGKQLAQVLKKLSDRERVVLVNDHVDRAWEKPNNKTLQAAAKKFDNVTLVDWKKAASKNPKWLADDGMHLQPAGARAYSKLIMAALV